MKRIKRGLMSCPQIQLSPGGKNYSFDHLRAIIEKVEELKETLCLHRENGGLDENVYSRIDNLLEVYEDED